MNRFSYLHIFTLISVVLLVPASTQSQVGRASATLTGTVSETVALSVVPNSTFGNFDAEVVNSGNTVRITLSGDNVESPVIRVPLLVRSNSGFRISAAVESKSALLTQLSVVDVRATGTLVSAQAISDLNVSPQFDVRGLDESTSSAPDPLDVSRPLHLLSGPRVSLAGTYDSQNNALQITVLIRLQAESTRGWLVHLTFCGTAINIL